MCGEIEDYLEALSIFADSISQKSEKIESAFEKEDLETFTTLVHSLKSSARTIGANDVSEWARKLELAGKSMDLDSIRKDTPQLLAMYRALEAPLKGLMLS